MYNYDRRVAAVLFRDKGSVYEVSGSYNELKGVLKSLKSQGWNWDPSARVWTIPKAKLTSRQLTNIKKKLGIRDSEAPDTEAYEKVVKELKPVTQKTVPGGILVFPVGIDFRVYHGEWISSEGAWFLSPKIDSKNLLKDMPKVQAAVKHLQETRKILESFKDDSLLRIWTGPAAFKVIGPATYHAKDYLGGIRLRYERGSWAGTLAKVKNPQELLKVLERAREVEVAANLEKEKAKEEERANRKDRGSEPATEKQKDLLKRFVAQYGGDWFDITDGIGDMRPPSTRDIERMSRSDASSLIEMVLDWKRS